MTLEANSYFDVNYKRKQYAITSVSRPCTVDDIISTWDKDTMQADAQAYLLGVGFDMGDADNVDTYYSSPSLFKSEFPQYKQYLDDLISRQVNYVLTLEKTCRTATIPIAYFDEVFVLVSQGLTGTDFVPFRIAGGNDDYVDLGEDKYMVRSVALSDRGNGLTDISMILERKTPWGVFLVSETPEPEA